MEHEHSSSDSDESREHRRQSDMRLAQLKKVANKKRTHGAPMSRLEVGRKLLIVKD